MAAGLVWDGWILGGEGGGVHVPGGDGGAGCGGAVTSADWPVQPQGKSLESPPLPTAVFLGSPWWGCVGACFHPCRSLGG